MNLQPTTYLPAKIFVQQKLRRAGKLKTNFGMSLMETVVYVSLVALLSVLVVQAIIVLGSSFKAIRATRDLENSALVALDRVSKEIRLADAVGAGGVYDATTSDVVLTYSGIPATTREFWVDENRVLRLKENGADLGALTSANVSVDTFLVSQATTSSKTSFRVTLTLSDKRDTKNPRSATFYTAAAMRNLY